MKRFVSYLIVLLIGGVLAAVGLNALTGGRLLSSLPGISAVVPAGGSKTAVVAALREEPASSAPARSLAGESVVADAVARVAPAVVDVHTQRRAMLVSPAPFAGPMGRFFGSPGGPRQVVPEGSGSGVIISAEGHVLTNAHVVAESERINVKVGDRGYDARVVGADRTSDIAVVKIDPKGADLPVAELGDSDALRVGDWAIAVGNPLNIGHTVTLGIISAVNRTGLQAAGHSLSSVIQTDAAINPGNSGGALANVRGEVIGINTAIYSPTGTNVGIGFAIPINTARTIAAELIEKGKVVRPYLGVAFTPLKGVPPQARAQVGITATGDDGVVVAQVYPDSPAEQAGLRTYDVVLEANRQKITDTNALNDIIAKLKVGDTLALLVSREGKNRLLTATLRERPATFGQETPAEPQLVP